MMGICQGTGEGKKKKNMVGACNLATDSQWHMDGNSEEVGSVCVHTCSSNVCMGAVRKCKNGLEIS